MKKWKALGIALGIALVLVVVFQNREVVETRLLFATVAMPRALLLVITLLVGFAGGVITGARLGKAPKPD